MLESKLKFFKDQDKICCVSKNFKDLVVSISGFGDTEEEAKADYIKNTFSLYNLEPVKSHNVSHVGYSKEYKVLRVDYKKEVAKISTMIIYDVPKLIFENLKSARSFGSFFNREIVNQFKFQTLNN